MKTIYLIAALLLVCAGLSGASNHIDSDVTVSLAGPAGSMLDTVASGSPAPSSSELSVTLDSLLSGHRLRNWRLVSHGMDDHGFEWREYALSTQHDGQLWRRDLLLACVDASCNEVDVWLSGRMRPVLNPVIHRATPSSVKL